MELERSNGPEPAQAADEELARIVSEEEACLARVLAHLAKPRSRPPRPDAASYDERLLDLRDQIAAARMEDVPPLVQEMERLQALAGRLRTTEETPIDRGSPYFGRLVLEEGSRRREVLIGRGTYLDTQSGVRIVDWRDAPVSRLYYRYEEGDEYDEVFGDREVSGIVLTRRSVTIADGVLRRIGSPQGTFVRARTGGFRRSDVRSHRLSGGAGTALRAAEYHRPGRLGLGHEATEDKHLREITALIDPRQFELITKPDSGLVVIQGGAGSGKTTIALHRLAYLAFRDARRFRPDRMLVIVFNDALVRYIAEVLPALGVTGMVPRTYTSWAARTRQALYPRLPTRYDENTPSVVTRLKKHPAMLVAVAEHVESLVKRASDELEKALANEGETAARARAAFTSGPAKAKGAASERAAPRPLAHRCHALTAFVASDAGKALSTNARVALERIADKTLAETRDVPGAWADLLTDKAKLRALFEKHAPGEFSGGELERAHAWCAAHSSALLSELESDTKPGGLVEGSRDDEDDDDRATRAGVDGRSLDERARLDVEDDALLLLLHQRLRGPLTKGGTSRDPIVFEHILVDEAQDLSPVELAVVLATASSANSITLAGDVQQRMLLDNGFSDWHTVLGELGYDHVALEPLKLSYRSTHEIVEFSRSVLGPLAAKDAPAATRHGAPIELFSFGHAGDAVAFLTESLRELVHSEPAASVALIARFPEQADLYFDALKRAEVPALRRVAEQDFSFRPGIDVTDVRQVKGLEFDYVVLLDVTESAYPADDEARHLLHIAATRAAHQLWIVATGTPSTLLPESLVSPD
jgi:DNA helicase-2/ATP-dependent DNA helicase PcrA